MLVYLNPPHMLPDCPCAPASKSSRVTSVPSLMWLLCSSVLDSTASCLFGCLNFLADLCVCPPASYQIKDFDSGLCSLLSLLHLDPHSPAFALSHLLSVKTLDSETAIMSGGFWDYILNQLNAIASVNFQNNRTAQRWHTDQDRLASAGGSVTPP